MDPRPVILLGDSLTAGYGLAHEDSFPEQLQEQFNQTSMTVNIINAGVSGDTSRGGLERLDWAVAPYLDHPNPVLTIALGANDGLRGLDPNKTKDNIETIIKRAQDKGMDIFLIGMLAPPNLGEDYAGVFNALYKDLAEQYETGYYPFFLQDVVTKPSLNQADGIHPNAKGVKIIVNNIAPVLQDYLEKTSLQSDE